MKLLGLLVFLEFRVIRLSGFFGFRGSSLFWFLGFLNFWSFECLRIFWVLGLLRFKAFCANLFMGLNLELNLWACRFEPFIKKAKIYIVILSGVRKHKAKNPRLKV